MEKPLTNIKKYDTVRESKQPKGFWLNIHLEPIETTMNEPTTATHRGISTYAEALYIIKRKYADTPGITQIDVYVNDKLLERFPVKEGKLQMSRFSDFRNKTIAEKGGLDQTPTMKAEDRVLFMKGCVPFFVTGVNETTNEYGHSLIYTIQTDTASTEYEKVGKMLNIQSEYALFVKATAARVLQWHDLMEDVIENRVRLILVDPPKGAWDFDLYEED